jgi:hypothetical protein
MNEWYLGLSPSRPDAPTLSRPSNKKCCSKVVNSRAVLGSETDLYCTLLSFLNSCNSPHTGKLTIKLGLISVYSWGRVMILGVSVLKNMSVLFNTHTHSHMNKFCFLVGSTNFPQEYRKCSCTCYWCASNEGLLSVQWLVQITFLVYFNTEQWQYFEAAGFHLEPNYLPYLQLCVVYRLMINMGSINHLHCFVVD